MNIERISTNQFVGFDLDRLEEHVDDPEQFDDDEEFAPFDFPMGGGQQ